MFQRSWRSWLCAIGIFVAFLLIILAAMITYFGRQPIKAIPFLVAGVVIGFSATPFYYYFKARDKQPDNPMETQVNVLAEAGKQAKLPKTPSGQRLKPIYPEEKPQKPPNQNNN